MPKRDFKLKFDIFSTFDWNIPYEKLKKLDEDKKFKNWFEYK